MYVGNDEMRHRNMQQLVVRVWRRLGSHKPRSNVKQMENESEVNGATKWNSMWQCPPFRSWAHEVTMQSTSWLNAKPLNNTTKSQCHAHLWVSDWCFNMGIGMLTTCTRVPCAYCEANKIKCKMRSKNCDGCKACKKVKIWCEYCPEKESKGNQVTPEVVKVATALIVLGEIAERSGRATLETTAQIEIAESMDVLGCLSIPNPVVVTQGSSGKHVNPQWVGDDW